MDQSIRSRKLFAGGTCMSVIYIKEQGSYLRLKGEQVATQVLSKLMNQGIDIMYFTYAGIYIGNTVRSIYG